MSTSTKQVKLFEIKSEEEINKFNYYKLGQVKSKKEFPKVENGFLFELIISSSITKNRLYKIRFYNEKLMKFFISKLSKANFKRKRLKIKFQG